MLLSKLFYPKQMNLINHRLVYRDRAPEFQILIFRCAKSIATRSSNLDHHDRAKISGANIWTSIVFREPSEFAIFLCAEPRFHTLSEFINFFVWIFEIKDIFII